MGTKIFVQIVEKILFQKSCITYVVQVKPQEVYVPETQIGVRYHIWRLVTSPPFENFIMLLIILNTLLLMCKVILCQNIY